MTSSFEKSVTYLVLVVASIMALFPLGIILATALQPDQVGASGGLHFGNFSEAWNRGSFSTYLTNSVIVSVSVVVLSTVLSCLAGYAFGTMEFAGSTAPFAGSKRKT